MKGRVRAHGLGKSFIRSSQPRPLSLKESLLRRGRREPVERVWAVRNISLDVGPGQMLGVIGHNGAGKSTLLRLLGGVMDPTEGKLEITGRIQGLLDLSVGMHSELSGRENIIIGGVIAGLTRREIAARYDEIVEFAELEEFIDAPFRTYSSGMRLRLGFAIASHVRPEVLLIDEVLSVGDLNFQAKCLERVTAIKREGCAVVLISHDLDQVAQLCDHAIWLRRGSLVSSGHPKAIVDDYKSAMSVQSRASTPNAMAERVLADGTSLRGHENRFGSQEWEIEAVTLCDKQGNEMLELTSGSALYVGIRYQARSDKPAPIVGFSIHKEGEGVCLDLSTTSDRVAVPPEARELVLELDRLDLAPGRYKISAGLYSPDWEHAYDYHWAAYPLTVTAPRQVQGILAPPRRWAVR